MIQFTFGNFPAQLPPKEGFHQIFDTTKWIWIYETNYIINVA
jgi:hypothetical protein